MDLIQILRLIETTPPDVMWLLALVILVNAYTIIRLEWKIRSLVEILATVPVTKRGKPYPMELFWDRGIVTKRPLE